LPASESAKVIDGAFPHSREDTRRTLAAGGVRAFETGQTILRQGDDSSFVLVIEGRVALRRMTVDGRQLIVGIVRRGGLASILPLAGRPAAVDLVAVTHVMAILWRSDGVRRLATADPGLAVDILDDVLFRVEDVVGRLDGLVHQNALRRVARVLAQHADLFFGEPPVLSRADLPLLVGTSREMTGRVLRKLESAGIVARVGRHRLRLLDAGALAIAADANGADGGTARMRTPSVASRRRRAPG
jgi:CRP-like cAMP-binding protein